MKLVMISYRFEYEDRVEAILDQAQVTDFIRIPTAQGADVDGKHFGSQVHPGHMSQIWATTDDQKARQLLELLSSFRQEKEAHTHLRAVQFTAEKAI